MKKVSYLFIILIFIASPVFGCTSGIFAADATRDGRPLLWKHRDTSNIDNKVEYIPESDGAYAYTAVFNSSDRKCREAWTGMNSVGFAIMNTASYNIKDDNVPASKMDKEGEVMTIALKTCRTVDDFEKLLQKLPRPMGVEANFGVIDAEGNGAFFETNNHSYVKYDVKDAPGHALIRSNYSHSGRPDEGFGYIREANANHLLSRHIENHDVTPELLTEEVSRSFYHDLFKKDMLSTEAKWIVDQDFIPRYKSTGVFVIEGIKPVADASVIKAGDLEDQYILWCGMGYPPCADIQPVWCKPGGIDDSLRGIGTDGRSQQCDIVKERRAEVFSIKRGSGDRYINTERLHNASGTGYLQTLPDKNRKIYETIRRKRDKGCYTE